MLNHKFFIITDDTRCFGKQYLQTHMMQSTPLKTKISLAGLAVFSVSAPDIRL